jgi:hypothetical protein
VRVGEGPLSYAEAREEFESDLEHYLAGGELLPTCLGLSDETDRALGRVAGAVLGGRDPATAIAAAWVAFNELYPR